MKFITNSIRNYPKIHIILILSFESTDNSCKLSKEIYLYKLWLSFLCHSKNLIIKELIIDIELEGWIIKLSFLSFNQKYLQINFND